MTAITTLTPPDQMPDTIQHEGKTCHRTRYTGISLPAARRYGIEPDTTTYEYWRDGRDVERLHAVTPTRFFLD